MICFVVIRRLTLVLLLFFAAGAAVRAQVQVTIAPPSWGPPLPAGSRYYYLPEMDAYYDGQARQYVVQHNGRWVRTGRPAGYQTNRLHPVIVVDYRGLFPWFCHDEYRSRSRDRWEEDDDDDAHYRRRHAHHDDDRHEESEGHHREHSSEDEHDNDDRE